MHAHKISWLPQTTWREDHSTGLRCLLMFAVGIHCPRFGVWGREGAGLEQGLQCISTADLESVPTLLVVSGTVHVVCSLCACNHTQ